MRATRLDFLLLWLAPFVAYVIFGAAVTAALPLPNDVKPPMPPMPPDLPHRPEIDLTGVPPEKVDRVWQKFDKHRKEFVRHSSLICY
jgi:hypothetical protein